MTFSPNYFHCQNQSCLNEDNGCYGRLTCIGGQKVGVDPQTTPPITPMTLAFITLHRMYDIHRRLTRVSTLGYKLALPHGGIISSK